MFKQYRKIARSKKKLPLKEERLLILQAKKGSSPARKELLLHLVGFILFRIETTLYPWAIREYGDDIFQECLMLAGRKIKSYKLRYKKKRRSTHPVHLSSYLWKSITGLMFAYIKSRREIKLRDMSKIAFDPVCGKEFPE